MDRIQIIGLLITDRIKEAGKTQQVLTNYAPIIKSRLGFHEVNEDKCSRVGFILLQVLGNQHDFERFEADLKAIEGIEVQKMIFKY